jgi:hypothetical protein
VITRAFANLRPPSRASRVDVHPGVVVHCTGGVRPADLDESLKRWRVCQDAHQRGNGWSDIGYHFGVTPDGHILTGRGWNVRGAHAKGHNRWLGVVVLGKGTDITDDEQAAIGALVAEHVVRGGGPLVIPHNAVSRKSCPGPAVTQWLLDRFPQVTDGPG